SAFNKKLVSTMDTNFPKTVCYGCSMRDEMESWRYEATENRLLAGYKLSGVPLLELGIWCFSGAWMLEFGAFTFPASSPSQGSVKPPWTICNPLLINN